MNDREILIEAENLGKKFCRSLKRSLWYGVQDIARDLNPFRRSPSHPSAPPPSISDLQSPAAKPPPISNDEAAPALRADEFWALQNVSFQLRRGECLGLIGHNGAGKSTLLKILNGLIRPDTGRLTMRGRVGALIELSAGFNPVLTGRENIYNRGALLGFGKQEIDRKFDAIVDFAEIGDFLDMPVQNYSSGMQVRLGFAVSSQMEPDVLLLDEVLAVGDIAFRLKCINAVGKLLENAAVIFVSHSMPQIVRMSTSAMVLLHGSVEYLGHDLGQAVSRYLESGKTEHQTVSIGSREIEVVDASLSYNGEIAKLGGSISLIHGASPDFTLRLRANSEVTHVRIQFLVWNQEMMPVMDIIGKDLEGHLIATEGATEIDISGTFPALQLRGGCYTVSIHLNSADLRRSYSRQEHAFQFNIDATSSSGAHFLGVGAWRAPKKVTS